MSNPVRPFPSRPILGACLMLGLLLGAALVLYLSWVPDSHMHKIGWMPGWLGAWADDGRENSRTAVPLLALGGLGGLGLVLRRQRDWRHWLTAWGLMVAIVIVAELGQIFLPARSFDPGDIAWGAAGSGFGLAFAAVAAELAARIGQAVRQAG